MCPVTGTATAVSGTAAAVGAGTATATAAAVGAGTAAAAGISATTLMMIQLGIGMATTVYGMYASTEATKRQYAYQARMTDANNLRYRQQWQQSADQVIMQNEYQGGLAEYQNKLLLVAAVDAEQGFGEEAAAVNMRVMEEEEAASQEMQDVERAAAERVGQALASSELSGLNLEAVLTDTWRQRSRYRNAVQTNLDITKRQAEREKEGLRAGTDRKINSFGLTPAAPTSVNFPSYSPVVFQEQPGYNLGGALGNLANIGLTSWSKWSTKVYDPKTKTHHYVI